ncbi:MAG: DUF1638 domain-containing protein [Clostridiales Family XIII bacterium]|jgi:hypothetical protein|nr:DUF1638 domain-containing protein [Clostridiales Family XIII bacterium]
MCSGTEKKCILACETLRPEIELVLEDAGLALPVYWIDSGQHDFTDRLREAIQGALVEIPEAYGTVLLVFGFCGNAMVGVTSGARRLVMPKAADCIPIFLGSQEVRNEYGTKRYFFTEGYFEAESNTAKGYQDLVAKYGEDNARMVMREMLKHYENLSVVDTGAFDVSYVEDGLAELSEVTGVPVDVIPGNLRLIRMLITGDWPSEEFFIFEPGSKVTLEDSLSISGISQIG